MMRFVAAAAAALLLSGCGGESTATRTVEESVGYSPARDARVTARLTSSIAVCMAAHGRTWTATPPDPALGLTGHGLFGLDTLDARLRFMDSSGYGVVDQVLLLPTMDAAFRQAQGLDAERAHLTPSERDAHARDLQACMEQVSRTDDYLAVSYDTPLAHDFAKRLSEFWGDWAVTKIQGEVLTCVNSRTGSRYDELPAIRDDLVTQLHRLVGGRLERDSAGRVQFAFGAGEPMKDTVDMDAVMALKSQELDLAAAQADCTREHLSELEAVLAREVAPLVETYAQELDRISQAFGKEG